MKILVPVKRVIDYNFRVRAKNDGSGIESTGAKMSINPFDEIALEEAIRLKEKGLAQEIIAVTVGDNPAVETLRNALAMGADKAIHIISNQEIEPLLAAKALAEIANQQQSQLIIMGKQSIDGDNGQTGQMLAALLNWGQATFACNIEIETQTAIVTREVDGGQMTLKLPLPCVITTDLRLNQPRYITLPNIMKAKAKPVTSIPITDLVQNPAPKTQIIKYESPPTRAAGTMVANVAELMDKLVNEAKVID